MFQLHRRFLLGTAVPGLFAPMVRAETAPTRLIIPFGAGGSTDVIARLLVAPLGEALGRPVAAVNMPGNSGIAGAQAALAAPADGRTFLIGTSSLLAAHRFMLGDQLPYEPRRDFAPVGRVGMTCIVLAVPASRPWQNTRDLIGAIRSGSGQLRVGTSGIGTISHLYVAQLTQALGVTERLAMVHHAEGGGAQMAALAAGEVDLVFDLAPALIPLLRQRQARALAVGSQFRAVWVPELELIPAIPEIRPDLGLDAMDWWGIVAPGGTPPGAAAAMNAALGRVLERPEVRDGLMAAGLLPNPDPTPADFGAFWDSELPVRQRLVEGAGLRQG